MAAPTTKTELLRSHAHELVKVYIEFDGQDRPSKQYVASVTVLDGGLCQVTEYIYKDSTSTQVKAMKEGYSLWDTDWEADFTVSAT